MPPASSGRSIRCQRRSIPRSRGSSSTRWASPSTSFPRSRRSTSLLGTKAHSSGVKAVVLAAGYATRLYPLTRDRPKALLSVGGKPMLEHLLERLDDVPGLDEIHVVTNSKFAAAFTEWAGAYGAGAVRILDDGTSDEETKLGAIGDLELTIRTAEIDDDLLVLAGD